MAERRIPTVVTALRQFIVIFCYLTSNNECTLTKIALNSLHRINAVLNKHNMYYILYIYS